MHCLSNTIAIACIFYIILNKSASLMSLSNTYKMPQYNGIMYIYLYDIYNYYIYLNNNYHNNL